MREIKFRCYAKKSNKMWDAESFRNMGGFALFSGHSSQDFLVLPYPQEDYVLMQYTGLKDKNGVEIYFDCELLKHPKLNKTVMFVKDDFGIPMIIDCNDCINSISFEEFFLVRDYAIKDFEVIGNIYEHKHLLRGE